MSKPNDPLPKSLAKAFEFMQELADARSYLPLDMKQCTSTTFSGNKAAAVMYWEHRTAFAPDEMKTLHLVSTASNGTKRRYLFVQGKPSKPFLLSLKIQPGEHVLMVSDPWTGVKPEGWVECFKRAECIPGLHKHVFQPSFITRLPPMGPKDPRLPLVQTIDHGDILVRFYGISEGQFFEVIESHHLTGQQTTIYKVVS